MELLAEAVLLDLDGTLVDSTAAITRSWATWALEHGVTRAAFDQVHSHGRPSGAIVTDLLPPDRLEAATSRIEQLEVEDVVGVVALPGGPELLASLPAERWAIVTSCSRRLATVRMGATGISAPLIVTADDVRRGKPDPEPYLLAAERLGVDPTRCVVVEDAPAGLSAARAAGMRTIAVLTTHPRPELDATAVVETLAAVRAEPAEDGVRLRIAD